MNAEPDFHRAFRGHFSSLLQWADLDAFWDVLRARAADGWYIYAVGLAVPERPASAQELTKFIGGVDTLLRTDHHEDYCGIVYVDNRTNPSFIKIFDPNHLGVSCGFSTNPPLPGWILSRLPPQPLKDNRVLPARRQRWWQELWNSPAA